MPSTMMGLIEMGFIFSVAIGWGVFELYRLKRLPKRPPPRKGDGPGQGS